jgi:hypothetical protein
VIVSGIPTALDNRMGQLSIGGLTADYTQALAGQFEGIGAVVTMVGTQPIDGGKMLSNKVMDTTRLFFE